MVRNIPAAKAAEMMQTREDVLLVDVRERWEWDACHIDGALHLPLGQVATQWGQLPSECTLLVLCHHGVRSYAAAVMLEQNGFDSVFNVRGGIEAWALEVDARLARY